MTTALQRVAALAAFIAASTASGALAQASATDPDDPGTAITETAPSVEPRDAMEQAQGAEPDRQGMMHGSSDQGTMGSGMMGSGMMSQGRAGQGMMCSEMCSGMMNQGAMRQGTAGSGTMGQDMVGSGQTGGRMQSDMMAQGMHGHVMRIVFAIADTDGSGGLSLEELAELQRRVFQAVDADGDGNATPEELQGFMQE